MAQRKNPQLDAVHQSILRKMQQLPENKTCADCKCPYPRWASTNLGIFICMSCSGVHRKLGTHISQVRSVTLDTWTPAQIAHFQKFGNARAAAYFEACIPDGFRRPAAGDSMQMERFIRDKYERKRFITVENGGLGGAEGDRVPRKAPLSSNSAADSASQSGLGRRPMQIYQTYNDPGANVTKVGTPFSYGGMFRSSAPSASAPTWRSTRPLAGSHSVMTESQASLSRPRNAIQRASTVREIMNMGFPAELAARAAESSQGDLQRAVEWVLANSPDAHQPPAPKRPEYDLLDFGEPVPAAKTNGVQGGDTNTSVAKHIDTMEPPTSVREDFADFADFGAFESALPIVMSAEAVSTASSQSAGTLLSESIAGLYIQKGKQDIMSQQQGTGSAPRQGSFERSSGFRRSPQHAPLSSTGSIQAGRHTPAMQRGNQQTVQLGYSHRSSQTAPHPPQGGSHVAGFGNKQMQLGHEVVYRPGVTRGPPRAGHVLSQAQRHVASTGATHSPMTQTGRFGNTQTMSHSNALSAPVFTELPGAGAARPSESVQMRKPSLASSSERKKQPNEIPSFTWPAELRPTRPLTKETNYFPLASTKNDMTTTTGVSTSASPPPPPPPPQDMSITGSDVPPPPEDPPTIEIEISVSENPETSSVYAKVQQTSEAPETPQKDEAVRESNAPQEEQDEDPFAALSMLALSTATSKMKVKPKQPVKATLVDRAENDSNGPPVPLTNDSTGMDLDNLLG